VDEREGREEGNLGGAVYAGDILCQFFVQLNVPTMHVSPSTCFICICMPYRQDSPISGCGVALSMCTVGQAAGTSHSPICSQNAAACVEQLLSEVLIQHHDPVGP